MGLNYAHEAAHSVDMKHVYNGTLADFFLGDELFGADRTSSIEERLDNAVKQVQKSTTTTKVKMGRKGRGGSSLGKRDGVGRRGGNNFNGDKQDYGTHRDYNYDSRPRKPRSFGRYNSGAYGNFRDNGRSRYNGLRTCFICGSIGHQAKQCPKGG